MSGRVMLLTHAEVVVDPDTIVPDWRLNAVGQERHRRFATQPILDGVTAVYSSTERKAHEGAAFVAERLGHEVQTRAELSENDRSSTGFLPEDEFWPVVQVFFAKPDVSTRGWETARAAQSRFVNAVRDVLTEAPEGNTLIVAHGGVATLLRCYLLDKDITKAEGQPHAGGGCWFSFPRGMDSAPTEWKVI